MQRVPGRLAAPSGRHGWGRIQIKRNGAPRCAAVRRQHARRRHAGRKCRRAGQFQRPGAPPPASLPPSCMAPRSAAHLALPPSEEAAQQHDVLTLWLHRLPVRPLHQQLRLGGEGLHQRGTAGRQHGRVGDPPAGCKAEQPRSFLPRGSWHMAVADTGQRGCGGNSGRGSMRDGLPTGTRSGQQVAGAAPALVHARLPSARASSPLVHASPRRRLIRHVD